MFNKHFFTSEGLIKFSENFSKNLCHVTVNSESLCWITLYAALSDQNEVAINYLLRLGIKHLYDSPAEFDSIISSKSKLPIEFTGLRDIFFTYYISRVPLMLSGTKLSWKRPNSPAKDEIISICEYCIKVYADSFQVTPHIFISSWQKNYRQGLTRTRWWVPISIRDEYYYNIESIENILYESLMAMLELRYPEFLRIKSNNMQKDHTIQLERWKSFKSWLRLNQHVFIDKLGEHLEFAYPVYSAKVWKA